MRQVQAKTVQIGVLLATLLVAGVAEAAVPKTVGIQGRLSTAGGGPAADGQYAVTFRLYGAQDAAQASWTEAVAALEVKAGGWKYALGTAQKLDPTVLDDATGSWLGLQIGNDPELPRTKLQTTPFAARAQVAEGLACSGCVTAGMLDPGVLAGYAKAAQLSNVAVSGAYADLEGAPKLGVSCGTGLVVKGLKADGSLECVAPVIAGGKCQPGQMVIEVKPDGSVVCAAGGGNLPADGLAAVSNGLLTNVFDEIYASATTPKNIPDNNPGGIIDEIAVPDTGTVKEITVSVDIDGQTTSSLVVTLFDPNNVAYVLHDKADVGATLNTSWPVPQKTVNGDLTTWVGKNPKGTWRLIVADWAAGGSVGVLKGWSVKVKVLSTKKVGFTGQLVGNGSSKGTCVMSRLNSKFSARPSYVLTCPDGSKDYQFSRPLSLVRVSNGGVCVARGDAPLVEDLRCWGDYAKLSQSGLAMKEVVCSSKGCCGLSPAGNLTCGAGDPTGTYQSVSVGTEGGCAVSTSGSLSCWGGTSYQQPATANFKKVSVAPDGWLACGIRADSTVVCWGEQVKWNSNLSAPNDAFTSVSCGNHHCCGVRVDKTLKCWGDVAQTFPGWKINVAVVSGLDHSCAMNENGAIACWGKSCSETYYTGLCMPPSGKFIEIACGYHTCCGLNADGGVQCWGGQGGSAANMVPGELR
jgi:subtilisin-like proprotein convertase family protein